ERDRGLGTEKQQSEGYAPDAARKVDFLGSYPPGDIALGELRGPMREETEQWLNRISMGLSTQHATAAEAHHRLMLTKAFDLSARRKRSVALPISASDEEARRGLRAAGWGGEAMRKWLTRATVALGLVLVSTLALGQAPYPNRAIRMIVPFAPGGASDFVARIISPKLGDLLGQSIVVDNRPGASGNIGMDAAAKAAPDGYTIYLGNIGTISINPAIFANLSVNPQKDFVPITEVADVPSVLIVNPGVAVFSVAELVALAKAKP